MIHVLALLIVGSFLGMLYTRETNRVSIKNAHIKDGKKKESFGAANVVFILLLMTMILFSGLRTVGNDTATYIKSFVNKVPNSITAIKNIDWSIGANPLFQIYQIVIKACISSNPHVFILISSILVCTSYLLFIKKYSVDVGFSVFLLISFTVYAFTMAAMKQTLAIAIAIWTVPLYRNKRGVLATLLIAVAMLIHPYVFIFFAASFFGRNIWDKRTWIILIITFFIALSFSVFVERALGFVEGLGDTEYDESWFNDDTGVNIFRVAVYLVVPLMSFFYRKNIREKADGLQYTFLNMSIISSCFMILASLGGANMFGRMANYFDIANCLSLVFILKYGIKNTRDRQVFVLLALIGFCGFYFMYFYKYLVAFGRDWFYDFYKHISIIKLLK